MARISPFGPPIRQAEFMNLMHCPLCVGLAALAVLRAASHLTLLGIGLPLWPKAKPTWLESA